MMWRKYLLLAGLAIALDAVLPLEVLNQCPQSTDSNPDPPQFVYSSPNDCRYYFICDHGKPVLRKCKPSDIARYSEFYHTCVRVHSYYDTCTRLNAQRECRRGLTGLIGHPTMCHRFYNCSQQTNQETTLLGEYEDECKYPDLFDIARGQCVDFNDATCGPNRIPATDACDYVKNQCSGLNCQKCASRLPSCSGLPDGYHAIPGREWSKTYIQCYKERLIKKHSCKKNKQTGEPQIFSPLKQKCLSREEVHMKHGQKFTTSCAGKLLGLYKTPERPDVYYSCPTGDVFFCDKGLEYNEAKYLCEQPFLDAGPN